MSSNSPGTALITGAAVRLGSTIARTLHKSGYRVLVHYQTSKSAAEMLTDELNRDRQDSAVCLQASLDKPTDARTLAQTVSNRYPDVSLLINNASSFFPTPLAEATDADWDNLMGSNLRGPFLLCQGLADRLRTNSGNIINLIDVYARRPLVEHSIYCASKAGLSMLTRSLAAELAPEVRVNGIAPGAILWPAENPMFEEGEQERFVKRIPLGRLGDPQDIADLAVFLATNGTYITGQTISVDGGSSA